MVADIEIAQGTPMRPITDVAQGLGLGREALILKSDYVAKVRLDAVDRSRKSRQDKLVHVTGTTPTRYGEGKTLTTVGLGQALTKLGTKAIVAVREPSLGPVFGTKGGATGGGRSQILPMEEINLHFTGDIHAVGAANNLIAAIMDAHIFHGNELDLDPTRVLFPRCLDMNDRQLRNIVTGLGGPKHGVPREDGFIITAASEVMAILCLTEGIRDLKERLERIVVAWDRREHPVRVGDLTVQGAAAILLKDALMPNLVQTLEGTPAFVHGGPFANIAHGHSSVLADRLTLGLGDVVVTEAGFGSDLGGVKKKDLATENPKALALGFANLDAHIKIQQTLGITPVVAVNRFATDTDREVDSIVDHCQDAGVRAAAHTCHRDGGAGGEALARLVLDAASASPHSVRFAYKDDDP